MIALCSAGVETGLDVAQAFALSQLRKDQAEEPLPAGEVSDFVVPAVATDQAMELLGVNEVEELGKDELAGIHASRIRTNSGSWAGPNSNRSHPTNARSSP
jgi:hypothetical protein